MDDNFLVRSVVNAATDVCRLMLEIESQAGEAYLEQAAPSDSERVVAMIGIAGTWMGTGLISCSPELACKLSSQLLMMECETVSEDVLDAMAEMANMIFGNVKTDLEDEAGSLALSIPTVIVGRNFVTRSVGRQSWIVVPMQIGTEVMKLKLCLAKSHSFASHSRVHQRSYALNREAL